MTGKKKKKKNPGQNKAGAGANNRPRPTATAEAEPTDEPAAKEPSTPVFTPPVFVELDFDVTDPRKLDDRTLDHHLECRLYGQEIDAEGCFFDPDEPDALTPECDVAFYSSMWAHAMIIVLTLSNEERPLRWLLKLEQFDLKKKPVTPANPSAADPVAPHWRATFTTIPIAGATAEPVFRASSARTGPRAIAAAGFLVDVLEEKWAAEAAMG